MTGLRVYAWGMGDYSIFGVFSNIWSSVRLKIPPQFQTSWWQRLLTLDMANKEKDSFSFYLSIAVLLVFLYSIADYASARQCVIIIWPCPQNITEISFQKTCSSKCVVNNARNVTQFVWLPFSIEFQEFVEKKIYTLES